MKMMLLSICASLMPALAAAPLDLRLAGEWQASEADVRAVLLSAAEPLKARFPGRDFSPIRVEPKGGQRGNAGEYTVKLDTGGSYWSQYAYQFSHEFCHILCHYRDDDRSHKWFEEAVCEAASLFSLREMARVWEEKPPYPNWRDYAPHLKSYADELIRNTPVPEDLAAWYREHRDALEKDCCDRGRNRVVAVKLLEILEKDPGFWSAVAALNQGPAGEPRDFSGYLSSWHAHAPRRHGPTIARIARLFGITLRDGAGAAD
jgi:hypothetical protein